MDEIERLVMNTIAAFWIGTLVCCLPLITALEARAADPQQVSPAFDPQVDCPDAELSSIDTINTSSIAAITQGIRGLPCNAKIERTSPQNTRQIEQLAVRLQDGFDYYSWLTFIALNSPADGTIPIGKDAPTIWETWKQLPDVMLRDGSQPSSWSDPNTPIVPRECTDKFKKGMMMIHMEMEETYNEPFKSGPLFDQNGNYALFVIFMNHQMFSYIVDNSLYNLKGQQNFQADVNFPSGIRDDNTGKGKLGAVMIKASWKVLKPGIDYDPTDPNNPKIKLRFHMIDGLLYRPTAHEPCRQVKLGLIGFHVGHKTRDRQQWIWTTFEHHDNVPTQKDVDNGSAKGKKYSFYNSGCPTSSCPINGTPPGPWDPEKLTPPWDPVQHPSKFKSQIVRRGPTPIFGDVEQLNQAFHLWLRSTVWENYDLITTQWPSDRCSSDDHPGDLPDATCTPFPTFLANTTLETFSQQERDTGVPLATSSCISCHNNATTHHNPATRSDFTYILEKAH